MFLCFVNISTNNTFLSIYFPDDRVDIVIVEVDNGAAAGEVQRHVALEA